MVAISINAQITEFPKLTGPYLGQKPPGKTPEIFVPGIISNQRSIHSGAIFTPDGNEVYWTVMNGSEIRIVSMNQIDGIWKQPQAIREDSYSEGDIYRSRFINGAYTIPENLGGKVNTHYWEGDVCVAPDESFLIVSCWKRPDSRGASDLYISFRDNNGEWSGLKNMGEPVNSDHEENCPTLSADEKYFFFNRRNAITRESNIYWVDAKIICEIKAKNLHSDQYSK